jgi:hypothetical protein
MLQIVVECYLGSVNYEAGVRWQGWQLVACRSTTADTFPER